jgi:RNase adaptor protein for sRNA GlmZ degradation
MIVSFGYDQRSVPARAQKVFDVRDLPHAHTDPAFTDRFREITEYAKAHPTETIAIGCKKGQHRSRVLANKVATAARTSVWHLES